MAEAPVAEQLQRPKKKWLRTLPKRRSARYPLDKSVLSMAWQSACNVATKLTNRFGKLTSKQDNVSQTPFHVQLSQTLKTQLVWGQTKKLLCVQSQMWNWLKANLLKSFLPIKRKENNPSTRKRPAERVQAGYCFTQQTMMDRLSVTLSSKNM